MKSLPPFRPPYRTDAFEPYLGEQAVAFHYELTQGYVNRANKIMRSKGLTKRGKARLQFELDGAALHRLWWENLGPVIPGRPSSRSSHNLRRVLEAFGDARSLKRGMLAVGMAVEGSGWVVLAWHKKKRLAEIVTVHNHEFNWKRYEPLLLIDVWEHSYLPDYDGDRKIYLQEVYKLVDWAVVASRLP